MENTQTDFISVINSLLLYVDYQENLLSGILSCDPAGIKSAAVSSAKAAGLLNVPVILTSVDTEENGEYLKEIRKIFPKHEIFSRQNGNRDALSDNSVIRAIRRQGREKLIIAGLWTSGSMTESALHAVREGYDVFGLVDACGDISQERHNYGVHRMLKAGVTPITWLSLASEWMNGWAPVEGDMSDDMYGKYNAMLSNLSKY